MGNYHQPLLPGHIYHLFSRAVGREKLFISTDNYLFFLQRLNKHTGAVCSFYCYSLLPNHFHLLAKIHEEELIIKHFEEVKKVTFDWQKHNLPDFIMERFSNCLNSYTKSFNKRYKRKGSLFMDYLRRSKAEKDSDVTSFIWYVHKNAVHHQLTKAIGKWEFDSYNSILSETQTFLLRDEMLQWFGGKEGYIKFHQQPVYPKFEILDL